MFKNFLARTLWTLILIISIVAVLAFVWDVPNYLGYSIPSEFAKLPVTMFLIVAFIAGVAGIWSQRDPKVIERIKEVPAPVPETKNP